MYRAHVYEIAAVAVAIDIRLAARVGEAHRAALRRVLGLLLADVVFLGGFVCRKFLSVCCEFCSLTVQSIPTCCSHVGAEVAASQIGDVIGGRIRDM